MQKRDSGLFVARDLTFIVPKFKKREWIEVLPDGRRVRVSVDDSGTVTQIEENDALHARVRPKTAKVLLRRKS
jgi:hypothetical protein